MRLPADWSGCGMRQIGNGQNAGSDEACLGSEKIEWWRFSVSEWDSLWCRAEGRVLQLQKM